MKLIPLPREAPPPPERRAPVPPPTPDPPGLLRAAALFASPSGVLDLLAAVVQARLAEEAPTRRESGRGRWWVEIPADPERVAQLTWAAGGRAYVGDGRTWRLIDVGGAPGQPPGGAVGRVVEPGEEWKLEPSTWRPTELRELLGDLSLGTSAWAGDLREARLLLPGVLARLVTDQLARFGVDGWLRSARVEPMRGGPSHEALILRIVSTTPLSRALLRSLSDLPQVLVGRAVGPTRRPEALTVGLGSVAPGASVLLGPLVPAGEEWWLGDPSVGHWRARSVGEECLARPSVEWRGASLPAPLGSTAPPRAVAPEAVRLEPFPNDEAAPDAILLEGDEVRNAAVVLARVAAREEVNAAFVAFGDGDRVLLLGPGGLLGVVPVGTPLAAIGPGALFRPLGLRLAPPLPRAARAALFPPDATVARVIVQGPEGPIRAEFEIATLAPAWSLWVGAGPARAGGAPSPVITELRSLAAHLPRPRAPGLVGRLRQVVGAEPRDRDSQLRDAARLAAQGEWLRAAPIYEALGELGLAARLFERAAREA